MTTTGTSIVEKAAESREFVFNFIQLVSDAE